MVENKLNLDSLRTNRNFCQKKSALTAKRQFIEDNYDYSTNVKDLSTELFRLIQDSNTKVSGPVTISQLLFCTGEHVGCRLRH